MAKQNGSAGSESGDWGFLSDMDNKALNEGFKNYGKFGDRNFTGNNMTLKNVDKWLKEAGVIGKTITTTDTSIAFKQVVGNNEKVITYEKFKTFLFKLAQRANKDAGQDELTKLVDKLQTKLEPSLSGTTSTVQANVIDRLTDTSKYTGSSKERFDAEGKGRGKEGREDVPNKSGYVTGSKIGDPTKKPGDEKN
ncbi:tubulin polymerization-promoting protein family member 2-like isoform X2 [Paramacrobiotus metropolitanus]|nr:tubulin polymerization-promoting protein family member 2-like isoform X2 [Paramacrobiotus metropolitanus]XP_055345493.1 tubulin polymerization-promoting protein family member 2-like isoform X2 [Paramacrobiotus metropolitanus]